MRAFAISGMIQTSFNIFSSGVSGFLQARDFIFLVLSVFFLFLGCVSLFVEIKKIKNHGRAGPRVKSRPVSSGVCVRQPSRWSGQKSANDTTKLTLGPRRQAHENSLLFFLTRPYFSVILFLLLFRFFFYF